MNVKLIDSLVQLIDSLKIEKYALLQEKLQARIIQKIAGVCGGNACISYTRIPVCTVISLQQQGSDYQEIFQNFPILILMDLTAVQAMKLINKKSSGRSLPTKMMRI